MDRLTVDIAPVPSPTQGAQLRLAARIVIPVWGARYVQRLDQACLAALLAPGNLPYLAERFDCELVVVTQAELFETVRSLPSVRMAQHYCDLKLVAMDDVLSHPRYYGYTITHALYRGVADLGERAKDTWCLFLNADFILADGSYRALADRMLRGERCILAPSYCTIEEDVRPALDARIAANDGVLDLSPRDMAGLILEHRHYTIRAKTINSRMYRIDHVDQFYYRLDDDTMLGRQIPIAVVAMRPERTPTEPVAFWDYGVISELCPSAELCVLGDSDDFLMLELRGRHAMADWLKLGWMDPTEIARSLSNWMTIDQKRCGAHPLVLHRAALPATLEQGKQALAAYYDDVMSRLANEPRDHRNHYIWTGAIELHREWLATRGESAVSAAASPPATRRAFGSMVLDLARGSINAVIRARPAAIYRPLFDLMRAAYLAAFGRTPDVGPMHPQYADLRSALRQLEPATTARALAIWRVAGAGIAPHLSRWASNVVNADPGDLMEPVSMESLRSQSPFDLCFLELSKEELTGFGAMHSRLRGLLRPGGRMVAFCQLRGTERVSERDFALISDGLPARDTGELRFGGGLLTYWLQRLWEGARAKAESGRTWDLARLALIAGLVGPLALLANQRAHNRQPGRFPGHCTSLLLVVTIN